MLAKTISALALTLLLTGGALAYVAQPQEGLQTELFAAGPHNVYAGHSNGAETIAVSEKFADAAEPHDIYAGHNNSAELQEGLQTQLFAADTVLSEPRQFD